MMTFGRRFTAGTLALLLLTLALPTARTAAAEGAPAVTAYVDGHRIPISEVSKYFCDDFSYPVLQCSSSRLISDSRALVVSLVTATDYVSIYEYTNYQGGAMNVSQDYATLLTIGWNDRISSFRARNSATGRFYSDWWFTGSFWGFCCNQAMSSLGTWDNTFSSMKRT